MLQLCYMPISTTMRGKMKDLTFSKEKLNAKLSSPLKCWWLLLALLMTVLVFEQSALATTYYVDFVSGSDSNNGTSKSTPWKRVSGMSGCTSICNSTSLVNGDIVIFKGGVTWTSSYPWTFQSGTSSPITYTVDQSWFTGTSWTQPTFDDLGAHSGGVGMANMTDAGYLTLNKLKFVNCGVANVGNTDKCLVFTNTHHITITDSTFACECWITIYFVFTSSGTRTTFTFTGNDFSHTSGAVWFASAAGGAVEQNIIYNGNNFHDYASQIGDGVHGDGAWHGFVIPPSDSTQHIDNLQFCDNRFYGGFQRTHGVDGAMTGFFFQEGGLNNSLICNNDMSFFPVQANMFDGLIVLEGEDNSQSTGIEIYGNTMFNNGTNAMSAAVHVSGNYKNVKVKNNVFVGMNFPFYIEDTGGSGATWVSDYNLFNSYSNLVWGSSFQSFSTWQAGGRDTRSIDGGTIAFLSTSNPYNLHIAPTSSAVGAGTDLSSMGKTVLLSDRDGLPRSPAYSLGAYQGVTGGVDIVPPSAPVNLTIK